MSSYVSDHMEPIVAGIGGIGLGIATVFAYNKMIESLDHQKSQKSQNFLGKLTLKSGFRTKYGCNEIVTIYKSDVILNGGKDTDKIKCINLYVNENVINRHSYSMISATPMQVKVRFEVTDIYGYKYNKSTIVKIADTCADKKDPCANDDELMIQVYVNGMPVQGGQYEIPLNGTIEDTSVQVSVNNKPVSQLETSKMDKQELTVEVNPNMEKNFKQLLEGLAAAKPIDSEDYEDANVKS